MASKKTKSVKTYFFRFDGELLFHNDCRPLEILQVFDTGSQQEVFNQLFDDEDGWTMLKDLFSYEFECSMDGGYILGCPPPDFSDLKVVDENNYLAAFVKHYVTKGYKVFFRDVDSTWVSNDCTAYAFVRSDDADKLLTLLQNCGGEDTLPEENTDHLDPAGYYKPPPKKKRKK